MEKLVKYNAKFELKPFGLINTGVTCYFNALLQSLLSCTSFTETIISHKEQPKYETHPITKTIMEIIEINLSRPDSFRELGKSAPILWKIMVKYLHEKKNINMREFISGQQCAREGYHYLLDTLDDFNEIQRLFFHRYKSQIWCDVCKKWISNKEDIYNVIEVQPDLKSEQLDIFTNDNDNKKNMSDFILHQKSYITDFKCSSCNDKKDKFKLNTLIYLVPLQVCLI
jgi:uncharacterized UBP type Zn finger protein